MSVHVCQGCGADLPPNARKWCSARCRKASYGDACVDCGTRTSYGAEHARVPEPRCPKCAAAHCARWTREAIITAIHRWHHEHGEPPAGPDWMPWKCRHVLHDEARALRAERWIASGVVPYTETVHRVFGSWNAAILAAGFDSRPRGGVAVNQTRRRMA